MKFPGLEWLRIPRSSPFYFPTCENCTTGSISELVNVQVNAEVKAKSRNALTSALQDPDLC